MNNLSHKININLMQRGILPGQPIIKEAFIAPILAGMAGIGGGMLGNIAGSSLAGSLGGSGLGQLLGGMGGGILSGSLASRLANNIMGGSRKQFGYSQPPIYGGIGGAIAATQNPIQNQAINSQIPYQNLLAQLLTRMKDVTGYVGL